MSTWSGIRNKLENDYLCPALAAKARSPYGARELRRQVDRAVEQALANEIASGTAAPGQHWTADCTADGCVTLQETDPVSAVL